MCSVPYIYKYTHPPIRAVNQGDIIQEDHVQSVKYIQRAALHTEESQKRYVFSQAFFYNVVWRWLYILMSSGAK